MIRALLLSGAFALSGTCAAAPAASSAHPLLDFARAHQSTPAKRSETPAASQVRYAQHALEQSKVPPDAECAHTLGAARFADLYVDLGVARSGDGDFTGAAQAYAQALACQPRQSELYAAIAGAEFDARDYPAARAAIDASLAIDPRSVEAIRLAGNIDFVAEHWADAIAHYRYAAASDPDRVHASYGQLMLWLAQSRAGIAHPELVVRTPGEGWPQPLLLYMRGEYTEAELIEQVEFGDHEENLQANTSTNERLCEALFYVGEAYWARGDKSAARDYFAALVNLRVIYFLEHGLALAEIAKLRD